MVGGREPVRAAPNSGHTFGKGIWGLVLQKEVNYLCLLCLSERRKRSGVLTKFKRVLRKSNEKVWLLSEKGRQVLESVSKLQRFFFSH